MGSAKQPSAVLIGQFYAERNREYSLERPVLSVGRSPENALRIRSPQVSDRHIRIRREGEGYVLEVVAEDAATSLNGARLAEGEQRQLRPGDVIGVSDLEFRFAEGERPAGATRLLVVGGVHRGKVFRLDAAVATLGRAVENAVQFPDRTVSRRHCRVSRRGGEWWIEDLGSTNGTLLNGEPLQAEAPLRPGDEVRMGLSRFVFEPGVGEGAVRTVRRGFRWN